MNLFKFIIFIYFLSLFLGCSPKQVVKSQHISEPKNYELDEVLKPQENLDFTFLNSIDEKINIFFDVEFVSNKNNIFGPQKDLVLKHFELFLRDLKNIFSKNSDSKEFIRLKTIFLNFLQKNCFKNMNFCSESIHEFYRQSSITSELLILLLKSTDSYLDKFLTQNKAYTEFDAGQKKIVLEKLQILLIYPSLKLGRDKHQEFYKQWLKYGLLFESLVRGQTFVSSKKSKSDFDISLISSLLRHNLESKDLDLVDLSPEEVIQVGQSYQAWDFSKNTAGHSKTVFSFLASKYLFLTSDRELNPALALQVENWRKSETNELYTIIKKFLSQPAYKRVLKNMGMDNQILKTLECPDTCAWESSNLLGLEPSKIYYDISAFVISQLYKNQMSAKSAETLIQRFGEVGPRLVKKINFFLQVLFLDQVRQTNDMMAKNLILDENIRTAYFFQNVLDKSEEISKKWRLMATAFIDFKKRLDQGIKPRFLIQNESMGNSTQTSTASSDKNQWGLVDEFVGSLEKSMKYIALTQMISIGRKFESVTDLNRVRLPRNPSIEMSLRSQTVIDQVLNAKWRNSSNPNVSAYWLDFGHDTGSLPKFKTLLSYYFLLNQGVGEALILEEDRRIFANKEDSDLEERNFNTELEYLEKKIHYLLNASDLVLEANVDQFFANSETNIKLYLNYCSRFKDKDPQLQQVVRFTPQTAVSFREMIFVNKMSSEIKNMRDILFLYRTETRPKIMYARSLLSVFLNYYAKTEFLSTEGFSEESDIVEFYKNAYKKRKQNNTLSEAPKLKALSPVFEKILKIDEQISKIKLFIFSSYKEIIDCEKIFNDVDRWSRHRIVQAEKNYLKNVHALMLKVRSGELTLTDANKNFIFDINLKLNSNSGQNNLNIPKNKRKRFDHIVSKENFNYSLFDLNIRNILRVENNIFVSSQESQLAQSLFPLSETDQQRAEVINREKSLFKNVPNYKYYSEFNRGFVYDVNFSEMHFYQNPSSYSRNIRWYDNVDEFVRYALDSSEQTSQFNSNSTSQVQNFNYDIYRPMHADLNYLLNPLEFMSELYLWGDNTSCDSERHNNDCKSVKPEDLVSFYKTLIETFHQNEWDLENQFLISRNIPGFRDRDSFVKILYNLSRRTPRSYFDYLFNFVIDNSLFEDSSSISRNTYYFDDLKSMARDIFVNPDFLIFKVPQIIYSDILLQFQPFAHIELGQIIRLMNQIRKQDMSEWLNKINVTHKLVWEANENDDKDLMAQKIDLNLFSDMEKLWKDFIDKTGNVYKTNEFVESIYEESE